jgi:hypothetical protein
VSEENGAKEAGCLVAVLWAVLVQPLWYVLLFGILRTIESEPYMWVCYWIYLPSGIAVGLLSRAVEMAKK